MFEANGVVICIFVDEGEFVEVGQFFVVFVSFSFEVGADRVWVEL